jgi:hypothetical protein
MSNPTVYREICGTKQGFVRHKEMREHKCAPCREAYFAAPTRLKTPEIIAEIEHMLGIGQGSGYILKAIDYTGRENRLRDRLSRTGRIDLYNRLLGIDYQDAA